jgi:hypothetical protein
MRRHARLIVGLLCLLVVSMNKGSAQEATPEPIPQAPIPGPELEMPPPVDNVVPMEMPSFCCGLRGISFGMGTPPPPQYNNAPGPISDHQANELPPGPPYSAGQYYAATGASPPLTGYGPRPGLAYIPDTKVDCKTSRIVAVDPRPSSRLKSLCNKIGHCCWATHNEVGCSNLKAECTFIFGSCRQFWGDPCLPNPPPLPLPADVNPIPQPPCHCNW